MQNKEKELLKIAKEAISTVFEKKPLQISEELRKKYGKKQGVFVTIKKDDELRGCIGFPEPIEPLYNAIVEAARAAAFRDPRFPPLRKEELNEIKLEVSVLTLPEEIKCSKAELVKNIKVGRDGLIVRMGFNSGLLLPQVPVEWNWNEKEFLEQTCIKAGLYPDAWKDKNCNVYKFQAEVFSE